MKNILSAVVVFVFLASPGLAANQFVRCVQEQLVALGVDPGPIDGALGKRTRAALAQVVEGEEKLAQLPRISNRYAVTWCRKLGQIQYGLDKFYPSDTKATVTADDDEESFQQAGLLTMLTIVRTWYERKQGIKLASRVDLVASASPQKLAQRLRKAQVAGGFPKTPSSYVKKKCTDKGVMDAFAGKNFISVCFKGQTDFSFKWYKKTEFWLGYVLAHEFFHAIQFEYAAAKQPVYYQKSKGPPPSLLRPSWMVEGSADYMANNFLFQKYSRYYGFKRIFKDAAAHKRTLPQISKVRHLSKRSDYDVSRLAVHLLAERYGIKALVDYWHNIGLGMTHDASFRKSFKMSLVAYQRKFEDLRKDFEKAKAFAHEDLDLTAPSDAGIADLFTGHEKTDVLSPQKKLAFPSE